MKYNELLRGSAILMFIVGALAFIASAYFEDRTAGLASFILLSIAFIIGFQSRTK